MRTSVALSVVAVQSGTSGSPDKTRVPPSASIAEGGRVWELGEDSGDSNKRNVIINGTFANLTAYQILLLGGRIYLQSAVAWWVESPMGSLAWIQHGPEDVDPALDPPVNRAPVWSVDDIIFVEGVSQTVDLRDRCHDPDGDPLAFFVVDAGATALLAANGVTFDPAKFWLQYDGRDLGLVEGGPPLVIETGIVVSADDGRALP